MELPYVSEGLGGIGGRIKEKAEDFVVDEVLLYEPCDSGQHVYVNLTKKEMTSRDVQVGLSRIFGVCLGDVGVAGRKDKHSVSTQTFSLNIREKMDVLGEEEYVKKKVESLGVKVNWIRKHKNKLRVGHLLGNRFKILVRGVCEGAYEKALTIKRVVEEKGIPNYYGPQRFGVRGENAENGLSIIKGGFKVKERWKRNLYVSSYQSHLCNMYLAKRVRENKFGNLIKGDIAKKHDTGGLFLVQNLDEEQKRYERREISFTAPVYGSGMLKAEDESGKFEAKAVEGGDVSIEELEKYGVGGTRRTGRLILNELEIENRDDGLLFKFFLPKGGYATIVMREFMKGF